MCRSLAELQNVQNTELDIPTGQLPKVLASWLLQQENYSRSSGMMCARVKQGGDKCDKNSSHTVVSHAQNRKRTWKQMMSWFHPQAFIKGTRRFSLSWGYSIFLCQNSSELGVWNGSS